MRRSRIAWGLVLLAVGSSAAWAEGLDKGSCNVLKAELAGLVGLGTRDDMERGPEWAKANLSDKKLQDIFRLIEVEEQLEFRCGMSRQPGCCHGPGKDRQGRGPRAREKAPEQEQRHKVHSGPRGDRQATRRRRQDRGGDAGRPAADSPENGTSEDDSGRGAPGSEAGLRNHRRRSSPGGARQIVPPRKQRRLRIAQRGQSVFRYALRRYAVKNARFGRH